MQSNALICLVLVLCLTPRMLALEPSQPNREETVRQAEERLALSIQQNPQNHALALKTALQALELWRVTGDPEGIARTYNQIALCHLVQSDLVEATETYQQALEQWRALNNSKQEASTLIKLAFIEVRKGEWSSAISLLTQAQSLLDERDVTQMGQIASALGDIFNESGLPENGLIELRRAQEYFRQTPDERDDKRMILDIGNTYFLLGNTGEALTYLQQALASFAPDTLDAAQSHEYLARVNSSLGEHTTALQHLQAALPIYERIGNPQEAAQVRGLMGQIYQQQGNLDQARRYYQQALGTFQRLSDRLNEAAIHYALGRLALQQGNYDAAEDYLRQSIAETEDLRRVSTSRDLMAAFSATVHERYAGYIECLMHKREAVLAFETSELARARSLAELLRATQTNLIGNVDPNLVAQEKTLRQALRAKEDYKIALLGRDYKKEELDTLNTELRALEAQYKQVTENIRARYPSYEEITRPAALNLRQIQEQVIADDQTILLEYSLGSDRSYLWAVTRTELSSYELPGRREIESAARNFYNSLTANQPKPGETFDQTQARAREAEAQLPSQTATLSKLLLAPVADKLATKRLLIVADGALQYIPFQALTLPARISPSESAAEQRPLILDHEIVNELSASILALVLSESAKRAPAPRSVAILADPVFEVDDSRVKSPGLGPLQAAAATSRTGEVTRAFRDIGQSVEGRQIPRLIASREEAGAIMAIVPWRTGFKAVDFDANRATASGSDLGQYRIVHFATHALLDSEHPEFSGIVLSLVDQTGQPQDGFLRMHDIYNLKLPVDLVVLSACNTALGKDVRGEGLIGLTRGFMYAGASGVVASLWKVDDEATAELMKRFYEGMFKDGLTPAAALRQAQLAMRRQKRWHAPYYWAGFVIQGQYNQKMNTIPKPTRIVEWAVTLGSLAVLVSLVFFLLRRRRRKIL
jgi:CHAT domain-containing protein